MRGFGWLPRDGSSSSLPSPRVDSRSACPRIELPSNSRHGLVVRAFPVLTVFVDNRKIHDTPVDMKLPVGRHKLKLVNPETSKTEQLTITIEETKPTTIDRM